MPNQLIAHLNYLVDGELYSPNDSTNVQMAASINIGDFVLVFDTNQQVLNFQVSEKHVSLSGEANKWDVILVGQATSKTEQINKRIKR